MSERVGYVLAGGQARRLGEDKARAQLVGGVTLLAWVTERLSPAVASWTAVGAKAGEYEDLGVRTIGDRWPGQGPLGGIATAAIDRGRGWFFVTSCDAVWARAAWVEQLWEARRSPAVVFEHQGRLEPLFGWYRAELAPDLEAAMEGGQRSVWRFLEAVGARRLDAPGEWESGQGINDPQALARARAKAQKILRGDR
ncbi:molybdenum cofactor guanylyltransferase [Lujinxingia vulgaris]|uniref:molybdenum cofactor guanylyltransferase n=1 Tax=Lujinxingia vulgaris TaxID=2600176 RepID=UPI001E2F8A30|nr:molybdenum cofactor guanylyltransferase [Lujinxingia vulgaris]